MSIAASRLVPGARPTTAEAREDRVALAISVGLHLGILLLVIFGLPHMRNPPPPVPMPISISVAPISDIARTTRQAKPVEDPEDDDTPSKANQLPETANAPPPPPEPAKQEPVKQAPVPPPPPPPPPPKAEAPAVEPIKPVQQLQQQIQQQIQTMPPLQKPMQIIKPKPVQKPPEQKVDKRQDQDFDALLKNLSHDQKADEITHDKPVQSRPRGGSEGMQSNAMTASEKNLIQERLKACWVFPAGAYDAENLVVHIDAEFNENKTLRSAAIVESGRYNSDPAFRAAGDAALRALRNPMCNPLPLPDGKYADWGTINMTFDPKLMMAP